MRGLMMDVPLTVRMLLDRAEALFGDREIVSRRPNRSVHRTDLGTVVGRSRRLAAALQGLGIERGDRVATLAWNHHQHLEAYLGVPSMGAVLHTLNLRLHPDDLLYIINHAGDRVLLVDEVLLPLLASIPDLESKTKVEHIVVMSQAETSIDDARPRADGYLDYEQMLAAAPADFEAPAIDELDAATMCYTSGTTGRPKGVVYSHRSTLLHALAVSLPDSLAIGEHTVCLPVVPMFHVNAWGLPYACTMAGAKQVFPGPHMDAASICELLASERVTLTGGVPTIWMGILEHLDGGEPGYDLSAIEMMAVGGAAVPEAVIAAFEQRHGLRVVHAWGMTETSPLGTVSNLGPRHAELSADEVMSLRSRQGRMVPLVEVRARSDDGAVPWDSSTMGELEVRGPCVAGAYYDDDSQADRFTEDGWFRTGDIVTIDPEGYIRIEDRSKDVIKSGGEWISSIALENAIMAHPSVEEAAVIPVAHPRWQERPLAVIVPASAEPAIEIDELREFLAPHFASWWLPDAVEAVEEIPRTSTGKFLKSALRERFRDYELTDS